MRVHAFRRAARDHAQRSLRRIGQQHVVQHAQVRHQRHFLERGLDAQRVRRARERSAAGLPCTHSRPALGSTSPDSSLTMVDLRAVLAQQRMHGAGQDVERHVVHRHRGAIGLAQALRAHRRRLRGATVRATSRRHAIGMPRIGSAGPQACPSRGSAQRFGVGIFIFQVERTARRSARLPACRPKRSTRTSPVLHHGRLERVAARLHLRPAALLAELDGVVGDQRQRQRDALGHVRLPAPARQLQRQRARVRWRGVEMRGAPMGA